MPITSTPPPARTKTTAKPVSSPARTKREERLEAVGGLGQLAQAGLIMTGQFADAGAVGLHFGRIASEVVSLAETDTRVAAVIEPLLNIGPYAALVTAMLPLAMQILVNHGKAKPGALGTVSPATLESQIKTALAKAELEQVIQQKAAEEEAARIQQEMQDQLSRLREAA